MTPPVLDAPARRGWRHRLAAPAAAAVLACAAGCGVQPTGVIDGGPAPVISAKGAVATVYLLRDGRLAPKKVATASAAAEDVIAALFDLGRRPGDGLGTALDGYRLEQSVLSRYGVNSGVRNDPENPVGLRLHVIVNGPGRLSRTAVAQITCTARLRDDIWAVKITQTTNGGPTALGEHTCREYHDLAADTVNLPP
ncbi:hypothetical protein Sru01_27830 [Sphaerisporangium rufum]|uniref:Uncharacterized protein n=1 Tax=Sphaerisporangium rufum TaxID=1381558 RepID=A0A919UY89_9ACTN|nr:hypothetical protein [Sphaerisporangium rufum]GII77801.1 hypothetical protein Sru01_27830 [Sphaerisporangium rufum]